MSYVTINASTCEFRTASRKSEAMDNLRDMGAVTDGDVGAYGFFADTADGEEIYVLDLSDEAAAAFAERLGYDPAAGED